MRPIRNFTIYKPTYPAGIDWSLSHTEGLAFYCLFDGPAPLDLITGVPGVHSGGPTFRGSPDGVAANLASASSQYFEFEHRPEWNITGDKTLYWRGSVATGSAYRHLIGKSGASNETTTTPWSMWFDATATPTLTYISANTTYRLHNGPTVSLNNWHTLAVRASTTDASPSFFQDGTFSTGANSGTATGAPTTNTNPIRVGRRADGAVQMDGVTSVAGVWARRLQDEQLQELHNKPFLLFRSSPWRSRASSAVVTSGAGAASGTGAASGVGAAIFAGVGAASGTGAASGVGAAIFSGAGAADGVGTAVGVGTSTAASAGAGAGTGDAVGTGASTFAGTGASAGVGDATGVGLAVFAGIGLAAGAGDATGVGLSIFSGVGVSAGTGEPLAIGAAFGAGIGVAAGVGTATGVSPFSRNTVRLMSVLEDHRSLISLPDTRMLEIPINRQNEA